MTPESTPQSLITRDLEARSLGSLGRQIMRKFEATGTDLLGATRPIDLALALRARTERTDRVLEELLGLDGQDHDLALVVLVALAPELGRILSGSTHPKSELTGDLMLMTWEVLVEIRGVSIGDRRTTLLALVAHRVRSKGRRPAHSLSMSRLPVGFDREEPEPELDTVTPRMELFARAAVEGVIDRVEFDLIHSTHIYGEPLKQVADRLGLPYKTAQARRRRAETKLAGWMSLQIRLDRGN